MIEHFGHADRRSWSNFHKFIDTSTWYGKCIDQTVNCVKRIVRGLIFDHSFVCTLDENGMNLREQSAVRLKRVAVLIIRERSSSRKSRFLAESLRFWSLLFVAASVNRGFSRSRYDFKNR